MKKGLLFIAPLAVASLFSCGGGNGSPIEYDDAVALTSEYKDLVKDNRPKDLHIGGTINSFNLDGDVTIKSKRSFGEDPIDLDLKDSKFSIAKQDLAEADIPVSLIRRYFPDTFIGKGGIAMLISVLPSIPLSEKILYFFDGFRIRESNEKIGDFEIEHDPYKSIVTKYYKAGNKLKVTMNSDDMIGSILEISTRFNEPQSAYYDLHIPMAASFTFNEMGFIEDFSFSATSPGRLVLTIGNKPNARAKIRDFYMDLNASFSVDVSLHILRTYYTTVPLNFQAIEYVKDENDKLVVKDSTPISTDLELVKKYFTLEWSGVKKQPMQYDDPIAGVDYWSTRADKNTAFESDNYNIHVIPAHTVEGGEFKPDYRVLGTCVGTHIGDDTIPNNLCSISYNGYLISTSDPIIDSGSGIELPFVKYIDGADIIYGYNEKGEPLITTATECADLYIPAKYIADQNGKYIVSIAVMKLSQGE